MKPSHVKTGHELPNDPQGARKGHRLQGQTVAVLHIGGEVVLLQNGKELHYKTYQKGEYPTSLEDEKTLNARVDAALERQRSGHIPPPDPPCRKIPTKQAPSSRVLRYGLTSFCKTTALASSPTLKESGTLLRAPFLAAGRAQGAGSAPYSAYLLCRNQGLPLRSSRLATAVPPLTGDARVFPREDISTLG